MSDVSEIMRTAKANEFVFKRDAFGKETVEWQGLIFATLNGRKKPSIVPKTRQPDVLTFQLALSQARRAGFWNKGTPKPGWMVSVAVLIK